jgi:hypothetical protein
MARGKQPTREGYKWCSGPCGEELPIADNFYRQGLKPDGTEKHSSRCKVCERNARAEKKLEKKSAEGKSLPSTPSTIPKAKEAKDLASTPTTTIRAKPWQDIVPQLSPTNQPIEIKPQTPSVIQEMRQQTRSPPIQIPQQVQSNTEAFTKAIEDNNVEIINDPYEAYDIEMPDDTVYVDNDDDDQIRTEYKTRNPDDQYQSSTERLIAKRRKLLELMQAYPDIAKALALTKNKVYKMKNIEDMDNAILNFSVTDSINTLTRAIKLGVVGLAGVIESSISSNWFVDWIFGEDYASVVEHDPELDVIAREMAVEHSEQFAQYCTPEARLMMMMGKDLVLTHNHNAKKRGLINQARETLIKPTEASSNVHPTTAAISTTETAGQSYSSY